MLIVIIAGAIMLAIMAAVIIGATLISKKCPKCKKFSLKKVSEEELERVATTRNVRKDIKDASGKVIRTEYKEIPVTKITYKVNYKCKNCGEEISKIRHREDKPLIY